MLLMLLFFVAFLAFMGGYEAGWYVARPVEADRDAYYEDMKTNLDTAEKALAENARLREQIATVTGSAPDADLQAAVAESARLHEALAKHHAGMARWDNCPVCQALKEGE